jgi:large subunit ribosomal protein L24
MKKKFSTSWIGSKQARKQRKYRYNAPLHIRHRFLSANLSKELRKKHGKRNAPLKKGDEVLVMRGSFKGKKGKILDVNLKRSRVTVENVNRQKKDGTKINVYFNPSNLIIQALNLEDGKRFKERNARENSKLSEKNAPQKN